MRKNILCVFKVLPIILFFLAHSSNASYAEVLHGIAMHGTPKYTEGFKHFDYVNSNAPKGGPLRIAILGSFDSLNPFIIKGNVAAGLGLGGELYFEKLTMRSADEPFTVYGWLAEKMEVDKERTYIIFHLRKEARWHDGSPITADDVMASYHFLRENGRPNMRLYYSKVIKVEKLGPLSIKFTLPRGEQHDPELPLILALLTVLPKKEIDTDHIKKVTLKPIMGSGPYEIKEIKPGRSITFQRRKDYWGTHLPLAKGKFNFAELHFEYYKDSSVILEALKSGYIDVVEETDPSRWYKEYQFPAHLKKSIIKAERPITFPAGMLGFVFNTRRPIFKDLRVRQALNHLFDFNWINKNFFYNSYKRTTSFFENSPMKATGQPSSGELVFLEPLKPFIAPEVLEEEATIWDPQDNLSLRERMQKALTLLQEAGWRQRKGKLYHKETNKPFSFEILLKGDDFKKVAMHYATNLRRIGINVTLRIVDPSQYLNRVTHYDFDMMIYLFGQTLSPGNEQQYYWSSKAADTPGTRNYMGIKDAAVDSLCTKIFLSQDRETLINTCKALDRVLKSGYYVIPLYYCDREFIAYWKHIGMPEFRPEVRLSHLDWWFKKEEEDRG